MLLLLCFTAAYCPANAAPAVRLDTPRPYGYAIGDTIRHVVTVAPEPGQRLDEASLPKPGPVNRWLELRRVSIEPGPGTRRRLTLEYQTFYAPLEVKPLTIPDFALRLEGPGGSMAAEVPAWPFSMAPIHGLAVLAGGGLEPLRPDASPESPDPAAPLKKLGGFGLAGLSALLYLGHLRGLFDFGRRGGHFREASLALRRLKLQGGGPAQLRAGFACVHRAFDRTLGEPLFAEKLPEFLAGRSGYEGLRREIEGFFRASYRLFFGDETTGNHCSEFPHPNPPSTSLRTGLPEGEREGEGEKEEFFDLARLDALCLACLRAERSRSP